MLVRVAPFLFVVLWATGFIGARAGVPYAEPFTFLTIRFAAVAAILAAAALILRAPWPRGAAIWHALIVGVLIHGAYLGTVFWAIDRGMEAGVSALIVSLQPILTALLAWPLLGETIVMRHWAGLGLGFAGVALVLMPGMDDGPTGITAATVGACIIGLLAITGGTIYHKRYNTGLDLRSGGALQFVGAACLTGLFALATESGEVIWSAQFIGALAWLVIVLSIGAISLLMLLIKENAVSQMSVLFYLVPGFAALFAWILFDEKLTTGQLGGMILVALALVLVGLPQGKNKRPLTARASVLNQ